MIMFQQKQLLSNFFFLLKQSNLVETLIFLFYDVPACNNKAEIISLATALIAHLRSQFNYVFALLISMPHFKSIDFC